VGLMLDSTAAVAAERRPALAPARRSNSAAFVERASGRPCPHSCGHSIRRKDAAMKGGMAGRRPAPRRYAAPFRPNVPAP
jgi:hypothetical protein